ncbi:P-loop containing nucleoside triphosphate hydrolase protein [Mucidula mucida]|nr:P-loop containing nucleoside triphosphate hydrolase protein [Mucidula mucida]
MNDSPNSIDMRSLHKSSSVLSYEHISFHTKTGKVLVDNVSVKVKAGHMLAIMGPSGAGKSTLLDIMSYRKPAEQHSGTLITLNDRIIHAKEMFRISCFVEQEDALLGVLTVHETVAYALRLHLPLLPKHAVNRRVRRVLSALGLQSCANQRIGTPIQRGISGGQKRRVTAACAMVTFPRILFLDEITSGLDSTAAREVMTAIRNLSVEEGMFVIATIHQPSLETLAQFSDLLLLAQGKVCYSGPADGLEAFFDRWGRPVPKFSTPAEHAMNFLNADFSGEASGSTADVDAFRTFYLTHKRSTSSFSGDEKFDPRQFRRDVDHASEEISGKASPLSTIFWNTVVLSERTLFNYIRNLLAYGVRMGMYIGMGLMIATIWVRLGLADSTINDRLSVHFYSVAFLAFMSVAGIPSFLEERSVFYREKKNGLYTTLPFILSNTIVNVPFLFLCTLFFSLIMYWAVGLHPGARPFFRFLAFLLLAIMAAESQVLIIASLIPIFVAALAIGAFMNGFWMSVGGYFIKARSLPRFWYYSFHFMDYQKYAFELLTTSDLHGITFDCEKTGTHVLAHTRVQLRKHVQCLGKTSWTIRHRKRIIWNWIGILVSIIFIYRAILYLSLRLRSN